MRLLRIVPSLFFLVLSVTTPAQSGTRPLQLIVDFTTSKGLEVGHPVRSARERIGTVTFVGFGERDTVEVRLRIDPEHRETVRERSTFVIVAPEGGDRFIEYYVLDPSSPPARDGARVEGAFSVAEVWLRRGRLSSEELSRALERGMEDFRENLESLRRSREWKKLRKELARLAAQMQAAGEDLARLFEQQLPRLQRELEELRRKTEEELARRRDPTPTPSP